MNSKRFLALLLAATMSLTLLAGCGNDKKPTEEQKPPVEEPKTPTDQPTTPPENEGGDAAASSEYLVWNMGAEPKTWDPNMGNENTSDMLSVQLFEGLTYQDVNGVIPGVAETWDVSEDGKTYTFHLRKDAKWSDGSPVTANDFYYAWMRMADPAVASPAAAGMLDYVVGAREFFNGEGSKEDVGIKAIDDYTFEVKLLNALPYFPKQVAGYNYCPVKAEAVETGEGWEKRPDTAVSNGPFKLAEYQIGSHLLLVKNENYWDADNVKLAGVKAVMVSDANTSLQGFEGGEIQATDLMPKEEMPRLIAENPNLYIGPNPGTYYLTFNCDAAPVNDVKVRKALTLAIDRKQITEQITRAGEVPATGFLPLDLYKTDDKSEYRTLDAATGFPVPEFGIDPAKANVEEAKKLLAEAGYPEGQGFPEVEVLYNTSDNHKKILEAVQQMWKENLGINVTLRNEEWNVFQDTKTAGKFQICRAGWIGNAYDASGMLKQFQSTSGSNDAHWRYQSYAGDPNDTTLNPEQKEFEDIYLKAMGSQGADRDNAWVEAEKVLMEYMPVCPIYYYVLPILIDQDKCENVQIAQGGQWIFRYASMIGE